MVGAEGNRCRGQPWCTDQPAVAGDRGEHNAPAMAGCHGEKDMEETSKESVQQVYCLLIWKACNITHG